MKPDINNLDDIILFVDVFYSKVKLDNLIGPIFTNIITNWQPHLERMYHFWDAALFGVAGFKGNPFAKHAPLALNAQHFDRWLILFNQTIDENFEGINATEVKNKAAIMASMFLSKLEYMGGNVNRVIV
ncbi:MAG: group III truncated hemoglobin [Sphingobacteriales bacterium]|nr:MAG: group III truncated hemoglobin [Sphingobacteriales bacterium]